MNSKEDILRNIYYDTSSPGSLGGVKALWEEAKKIDGSIELQDVKDWLSGELVYTLHKQARHKFKRNPFVAQTPKENMQADLVDMREFVKDNNGFNYILTAIDIFSKKAFAIPVKTKTQNDVTSAMEIILKGYSPQKLMTDKGKEFENSQFKALMKKYNVHHYTANNKEVKCAIVERFNRTLKNKMFRYFTLKGNRKFIDCLPDILISYNNSFHRSIKMKPNDVTMANSNIVFKNLYGFQSKREFLRKMKKGKFPKEGTVRKKYTNNKFYRGFYPNWSDEIFKIYKSIPGKNRPYLHLMNEKGQVDKKRYYPDEVQLVKKNLFRIEKIIRERIYRRKKQYFVKWLNHPDSFNSWIDAKDLTNVNG